VADGPGGRCPGFACSPHAEPRQRHHNVQCRRLFLLPCRSQPARSAEAGRRACHAVAVRDVLRSQHLVRSHYGIGRWSEADFVTALLKGTSPDGQHYFPAFPYASYQHATVEDIRDLFAYLKTLAPVAGKPRDHDVPFPFNIRRNVGVWKWLFMDGKPYTADASHSASWNRGAYLVNGLGHCAECHSPRNFLGGIVEAQRFAGGPNPEGEGWVPNITQKRLAEWSAKDIAYFLETGQTPDGDTAGGSMARVIRNTSQLPPEDRAAIAEYLKSLPPVEGPPRPKKAKDAEKS
jgi:mono/diheme cytochrome c family protein